LIQDDPEIAIERERERDIPGKTGKRKPA